MTIHYISPYSTTGNIGGEYNARVAELPDGWICITDGDAMFLTPEYGRQIAEVCESTQFSLIGCTTNRLGRPIQRHQGVLSTDWNIHNHYRIACELRDTNWGQVQDVTDTRYIAGMFMLFRRSTWERIRFAENTPFFDDIFSRAVIKSGGRLGLMRGLYMFHFYRGWSENPRFDKGHLVNK
jgi:hypothetical protein